VRLQDLQSVIHNSDLGDGISLSYLLINIDDLLILKVIFLYVGHFTAYYYANLTLLSIAYQINKTILYFSTAVY
jgi:hypothetical protein